MKKCLTALALLSLFVLVAADVGADDQQDDAKKNAIKLDPEVIFKTMDANKDGKVTKEEFKKAADQLGQGQLSDQIFNSLDANKDGSLSLEEAKKFNGLGGQGKDKGKAKGKGKFDPAKLKELQKKFGGKIDPEKLKELQKKLGKIDPEKLKELLKKKKGEEE